MGKEKNTVFSKWFANIPISHFNHPTHMKDIRDYENEFHDAVAKALL